MLRRDVFEPECLQILQRIREARTQLRLLRSGTFAVYAAPPIDIIAARRFDERRPEIHLSRNRSAPWD
jgi:hypothetical protein